MEVIIADDQVLATLVADAIERLLRNESAPVLGLATGSSPLSVYDELTRRHEQGGLSFAEVRAFMLDEYVGLPASHPQCYRNVIDAELVSRVDFAEGAVHGLDGMAEDLVAASWDYDHAIAEAGGIDLQILGIGTDGHIAFNEPGSSLASRTRVKTMASQTRIDNARFFDGDVDRVPQHCLIQGLGAIMEARHLVLIATGGHKAEAVHQMVEFPISSMWQAATIMQMHPHATVLVDDAAASRLQLGDYYRQTYATKLDRERL